PASWGAAKRGFLGTLADSCGCPLVACFISSEGHGMASCGDRGASVRAALWSCCVLASALIASVAAYPGHSRADEARLREAVELQATVMWLDYKSPGLVLAVVRGPDAAVLGFGETAKNSKTEPNGRSVFRIGSISKVFAGQLLASLAADGRLRLGDSAA